MLEICHSHLTDCISIQYIAVVHDRASLIVVANVDVQHLLWSFVKPW